MQRSSIFLRIVVSALIFRIGFVLFVSPAMDADQILSLDALSYHQIAQNIVERHIFTSSLDPPYDPQLPGTFRPPLTPFYLAILYTLFGVNIFWGRIGLAFISAVSCGLIYWLGEELFERTTGIIAGIISCGYPFFLLLVHLPLTEGGSIFLFLVLILVLYSYNPQKRNLRMAITIGIIFGLSLLNKASNITLLPSIILWCFAQSFESRKKCLLNLFIVLVVTTITIFPWLCRNYKITGVLIPVNSNGGWTFYLGNNLYTEKNLAALEQGITNGWIPPKEVFLPFSDLPFTDTKTWEKRSIQLGYQFIREHPDKFFHFAYRKVKIFWSPYHHIFDKITWIPVALFSILGIYYSLTSWRRQIMVYVLILSGMLIPIFFTSMPRFRASLMPFLIIYSAVGLVNLYRHGRHLIYANWH